MLLSSTAAYKLWATIYDQGPNPLLALEERMTRDLFTGCESGTIIDVGCGTGRSMVRYGNRGALTFGVDSSPEMLAQACNKRGLHARVVLGEATHLPFRDQSADLTLCAFALSYFRDIGESVKELGRVTKHDGRVVISDLHPAAAANGWTRGFRAGDNTYEIAHDNRSEEEVEQACGRAGLQIVVRQDGAFSEPERHIFTDAGKDHVYAKVSGTPAVRVIVCRKI